MKYSTSLSTAVKSASVVIVDGSRADVVIQDDLIISFEYPGDDDMFFKLYAKEQTIDILDGKACVTLYEDDDCELNGEETIIIFSVTRPMELGDLK